MFITPAYAQGAQGGGDFFITIVPFVLIFAIMYFLIIRPQQRRMKEHRELVANLRRGDTVVTTGGLIGKVLKVDEAELQLEIGDGMKVRVVRQMISEVRGKGEPAPTKAKK